MAGLPAAKLLPLGERKASVIVALIWAPSHLPLLLAVLNYEGDDPLAVPAFMTAASIGLFLLFTRMLVAAGGRILVNRMHGSLNSFGDRLSDSAHLFDNQFVGSVGGLIGFGVIALAVLLAYGARRQAVRKSAGSPQVARAAPRWSSRRRVTETLTRSVEIVLPAAHLAALRATPRARLLLLCSHRTNTGLRPPGSPCRHPRDHR